MVRKYGRQRHFGSHRSCRRVRIVLEVFAADLDGDGDMDLASASSVYDDKIAWYKNLLVGGYVMLGKTHQGPSLGEEIS